MDQIPPEILDNILFRLSILQKQECMLVCRLWEQTIRTRNLFHDICIADSSTMNRFISMVEKSPTLGAQVTCLKTCIYHPRLIQLFPNMRMIRIRYDNSNIDEEHLPNATLTTPLLKLESIKDSDSCEFTSTWLKYYHLGNRLHTLELNSYTEARCSNILALLKRVPFLKTLTLRNYLISLNDCELLHNNASLLLSLSLYDMTLIEEDELLLSPDSIIPATSIKNLVIDIHGGSNGIIFLYNNWNTYICKKYTRLTELHYRLHDHHYDGGSFEKQVFESSCSILLKTFPLQLKSFRINSIRTQPYSSIKLLDGYGCQLRHLEIQIDFENDEHDIFNIIADSYQAEYIEELTVIRSIPQSFDGLEDLIHLKSLKLLTCGSEIYSHHIIPFLDLNRLLKQCPPLLESIYIDDCDLLFDTDAAICEFQYAYIKQLTLKNVYLAECFDTFILTCLPCLHSLTLIETNDISSLRLPNRHFTYLEISSTTNLSVTLSNYTCPRFISARSELAKVGYSKLGQEITPIHKKLEDIKGTDYDHGWVDLICGSIDNLIIDGLPVVLGSR